MKYTTINDVIDHEILPALGESACEYTDDAIEEIARRTFEYSDGAFTQIGDADDFWAAVMAFDKEVGLFTVDVEITRRDSRGYAVSTENFQVSRYTSGELFLCSAENGSVEAFVNIKLDEIAEKVEQLVRDEISGWTNPEELSADICFTDEEENTIKEFTL